MTKLSNCLLGCILVQRGIESTIIDDYQVLSCNNPITNQPEITYSIRQDYFESRLMDQHEFYELQEDSYVRSVDEADLILSFSNKDDYIILSFKELIQNSGFESDDGTLINFTENEILFECHYARNIEVAPLEFEVIDESQPQPVIGFGKFDYKITTNGGSLGKTTEVQIEPNHGFNQISAKIQDCQITDEEGNHPIFLFHSMKHGQICSDQSRLDVQQTNFDPVIKFDFKTFRYGGTVTSKQKQLLTCTLRLEPANEISISQPVDCSCYSKSSCESYCIEVVPRTFNRGDAILVLKNNQIVNTIPSRFTDTKQICFPDLDLKEDIIELRHTGGDQVAISVNLIEQGNIQQLKFGENQDLEILRIDSSDKSSGGWDCNPTAEATGSLKIQNGKIIQSECVKTTDETN